MSVQPVYLDDYDPWDETRKWEAFLPIEPPKTTSQGKRLTMVGGKPRFFKSSDAKRADATYESLLCQCAPETPLEGPVRLVVEATWPWRKSEPKKRIALGRVWCDVKPDADNFVKQLQDSLVACRVIDRDEKVVELVVRKFFGDKVGIFIRVEQAR
jgi:Holliday junction resolvase RusA-like endonuclease